MKTRKLGRSGLVVSAIGLGQGSATTDFGARDDAEQIATMRRALDLGLTFFDTADAYAGGRHERLIGQAIKGRRHDVVLASKFGNLDLPGGRKGYNGPPITCPRRATRACAAWAWTSSIFITCIASIPRCPSKRRWAPWPSW